MGNNSNEHDVGSSHEFTMFCISIRRMAIFIMLNLGRRRVVSAIHIPLNVPQQRTLWTDSLRLDTADVARSAQLLPSHIKQPNLKQSRAVFGKRRTTIEFLMLSAQLLLCTQGPTLRITISAFRPHSTFVYFVLLSP